jgi:hypothetical protein
MSAQLLVHPDKRRVRRRDDLFRLDWREYWLLIGILGGLLALVGVIFLASSSFR